MESKLLHTNTLHLLKAYMASHATFNALTYIQHQITDDAKREALKALSKFASFIRKTVDDVEQNQRDSQKEYDMLECYCTMEQWRFADRLKIIIGELPTNFASSFPTLTMVPFAELVILLGLLAQPSIEVEFSFVTQKKHAILQAKTNFKINKALIENFSQEQENRHQLLTERIALQKNNPAIEIIFNEKTAQLILTT